MGHAVSEPNLDLAGREASRGLPRAPGVVVGAVDAEVAIARFGLALRSGRVAIPLLAAISAVLYLVNLTVSGYANTYYALAAQAASQSWTAWFFGSLDAQGFITIDKPPLSTMLMGLSVRLLGLGSWSVLLPQALLGVATVVVLYLAVRRSFGPAAALVAGLVMAITPVSVLIFRYDNPDALLTFLLVTAAWSVGRGLDRGRLRWVVLAAALVGAAFMTKYLQAYLVLPAFGLAWLVAAPGSLRRRVGGLAAAALTVAITSGWWVAIVELLPASARPYIGGSTSNSALELLLGYDGLARIFGGHPGNAGLGSGLDGLAFGGAGGPAGPSFGGEPGLFRMLNDQFGGQVGWLLPAALLFAFALAVLWRRRPRTDRRLAGLLLWGGWLVTHLVVFSFMSGIVHPYYTVILAPAIAALVGAGAEALWTRRRSAPARLTLAGGLAISGVVAWQLLDRTPELAPGLGIAAAALAVAAALVIAVPAELVARRVTGVALAAGLAAMLAGPVAYGAVTMASPLSGGDPAAGPATGGGFGRGPGGPGVGFGDGGLGDGLAGDALVSYLLENRGGARWIVAVNGSQQAAAVQLAAGEPVMAMGGFSGGDPTPSLSELQAYVASGELRFVLLDGGLGGFGAGGFGADGFGAGGFGAGPGSGPAGPGGNRAASAIASWVAGSCSAVTIDGSSVGLYDCAGAS